MSRNCIVIRRATLKDAAQLASVYTDAFGDTSADEVGRWLRRKDYARETLVAVVDGVVASAVTVLFFELMIQGTPLRTGGVAAVATRWDYRRKGLSTRLLKEAGRVIKAKGISNATLFTGTHLPAIRIYRRLGYEQLERRSRFTATIDPVEELKGIFKDRSEWLPRTQFARSVVKEWKERVLIDSDGWRATITSDGKKFVVQRGRRGNPTTMFRGRTLSIFESFWNRLLYDRHVDEGKVSVKGGAEARALWRRIVTMEWSE